MLCEIARTMDEEKLERIKALENELGMTIVAFSCRSLDPKREERLKKVMDELGPQLQAAPAEPDDEQLMRIRRAEEEMGVALVAVSPSHP
jgi:hypothetical protein